MAVEYEDLNKISALAEDESNSNKTQRSKRQLLQRLKANMPKTASCLNAVWDSANNRIIEDPAEVAYVVTEYWQKVFNETPINETLMKGWLRNFNSDLNVTAEQITVTEISETPRVVRVVIIALGGGRARPRRRSPKALIRKTSPTT